MTSTPHTTPWKRLNPRKQAGKATKHLTTAEKSTAKTRAAKAGRRYPNLVDNMAVAAKKGKAKTRKAKTTKTKTTKTKTTKTKTGGHKRTTKASSSRSVSNRTATRKTKAVEKDLAKSLPG